MQDHLNKETVALADEMSKQGWARSHCHYHSQWTAV